VQFRRYARSAACKAVLSTIVLLLFSLVEISQKRASVDSSKLLVGTPLLLVGVSYCFQVVGNESFLQMVFEHSEIREHLEMAIWRTVAQRSSSPYSIVGEH
jgi:hypothetical protein